MGERAHPGGARKFVESLRILTDAVHEAGAKIGIQLLQSNRWPSGDSGITHGELVGPSARIEADPPTLAGMLKAGDRVRELTTQEIETIIDRFAGAAAGVREAGFDFVELHLTHGYFNCQFFSPFHNRRKDKYGGDLKGRMRFGLECMRGMRDQAGEDFPLFCRLGAEDRSPGGITLQDSLKFAIELVKAGVDVLDISPAESVPYATPGSEYPMGTFVHLAKAFKRRVDVPVIAVGRMNKPEVAEAVLIKGQADLVAIGRQLIADPFWPKKIKEGTQKDIRPCLSCNLCVLDDKYYCTVNPAATYEERFRFKPALESKRVWVIGGGPGGMEAAGMAAQRGHKVILFEKEDRLGGKLPLAAALSEKKVINELLDYQARQVEKFGVDLKLNMEVTAQTVMEGNPDVVIIATGAGPLIPQISGIESEKVVLADDVLAGRKAVGDDVVVIGGELVGCDTALFLAEKGKKVTIVEILPAIAGSTPQVLRKALLHKLSSRAIVTNAGVKDEVIHSKGLEIIDSRGEKRLIEADTIVLATGAKPRNDLLKDLEGKVQALYSVGDCVEARRIKEAIAQGAGIGLEI